MITDISKYIDFLCDLDISESQFLILWLIHTKDTESIKKYKSRKGNFSTFDLEYLIDRGYLQDFGLVNENAWTKAYNIYDFLVTDKFTTVVVVDEEDAYEELCRVYPPWIRVNGIKYPTIKGDPEKVKKDYFKCHKGNKLAHQRIIDITSRYYKSNPPTGNIHDYILNRRWNLLENELGGIGDSFQTL